VQGLSEVTIESRPEFVKSESLKHLADGLPGVEIEVALGLESSSDWVRESCVGKGFSFQDFEEACGTIRAAGSRAKAYVLLKPPFLSEFDAGHDATRTMKDVAALVDSVSLNACNVQKGTLVEELFREGRYRPPWIWTVLEVLRQAHRCLGGETNLICDTVGFGTPRGPRNCRRCDKTAIAMVRAFSLGQDPSDLAGLACSCEGAWDRSYYYHF
jgi:radical SAM enzyme (TIGR01210 family)